MLKIVDFKILIVLCLTASLCFALDNEDQEISRKKKYHKYHLLYGGGIAYYLIFLAIKVKLIFIIGTTIAAAVFVGKIFAFLKYITLWLEEKKHLYSDHSGHDEKVIIHADPHEHAPWSSASWSSGPGEEYFQRKTDYPPYQSSYSTLKHTNFASHARNTEDLLSDNVDILKNIVYNMDLTDYTFDEMNIMDQKCRKKFICEADFHARNNSFIAFGLHTFSGHGFDKYRTDENIKSIQDCQRIYRSCTTYENTTEN